MIISNFRCILYTLFVTASIRGVFHLKLHSASYPMCTQITPGINVTFACADPSIVAGTHVAVFVFDLCPVSQRSTSSLRWQCVLCVKSWATGSRRLEASATSWDDHTGKPSTHVLTPLNLGVVCSMVGVGVPWLLWFQATYGLNDTCYALAENSKKQQLLDVLSCISVKYSIFQKFIWLFVRFWKDGLLAEL